jgi:hypothetical protein
MVICLECQKEYKTLFSLSKHIKEHYPKKQYYDKFYLKDNENICKICGKENKFINFLNGYTNGCCKEHMNKLGYEKRKEYSLKKFGVENPFQREDVKQKIKQTNLLKYGVEKPINNLNIKNKTKETNLLRYGVSHNFCKNSESRKKWEKRLFDEEGITNVYQRESVKEKIKQTNLLKYGVESPLQNREIHYKAFKTRVLINKYLDTDLIYQGSYEKDFLDLYFHKLDIKNGISFKYVYENKNKIYHSDFYIPKFNLIVEIKSSYTLKLDKEIKQKEEATIKNGFQYILIINKNYENFNKLINL